MTPATTRLNVLRVTGVFDTLIVEDLWADIAVLAVKMMSALTAFDVSTFSEMVVPFAHAHQMKWPSALNAGKTKIARES